MIKKNREFTFRIPQKLRDEILKDCYRPHPFAHERVGFLFCRSKKISQRKTLIIATEYHTVEDTDYIKDNTVGARINGNAIRKVMQKCLKDHCGSFHVHLHNHFDTPYPSFDDNTELPEIVNSLSNVDPNQINGYLILSKNDHYAYLKKPNSKTFTDNVNVNIIGYPMQFDSTFSSNFKSSSNILKRQLFLGENALSLFDSIRIGIIGYGGGGSHIGQQLAHLGVKQISIFDHDKIEESNLNRLIGGIFKDLKIGLFKTAIAKRVIKAILPKAEVKTVTKKWQESPEELQECDIILGAVDSYSEREQLESECRRYLIPYIDIGMDVHKIEQQPYSISGQVILSMPGSSCMRCYGFITDSKLKIEAAKYGDAGGRPQVVWPNGVLASTSVGILIDLITDWTGSKNRRIYLEYNGNTSTLQNHVRLEYGSKICTHYPIKDAGPLM